MDDKLFQIDRFNISHMPQPQKPLTHHDFIVRHIYILLIKPNTHEPYCAEIVHDLCILAHCGELMNWVYTAPWWPKTKIPACVFRSNLTLILTYLNPNIVSVGFWSAMLSILSSIVKSEFKAELEFDAGKLQRVEDIRNQLDGHIPTDHSYSHNVHRRSGGGGSMQISNDDFKFQPGICYYLAIPTTSKSSVTVRSFNYYLSIDGGIHGGAIC